MPIIDEKKIIFLHVPKTGGSSIEKALGLHPSEVSDTLKYLSGGKEQYQHLTLPEIFQIKGAECQGYEAFGIIRNPLSRMISEYKWRVSSNHPIAQDVDLNDFVEKIYNKWSNGEKLDSHFTPQTDFFMVPEGLKLKSINIFKFEDGFDKVQDWVRERIDTCDFTIPRINHTDNFDLKDDFSDKSLRYIREIFAIDFEHYE